MKRPSSPIIACLCLALAGCEKDNDPIIPELPQISFVDVQVLNKDKIILTIDFSDGDFDLGLSTTDYSFPYHAFDFFTIANGTTEKFPSTYIESPSGHLSLLLTPESNQTGKLATYSTVTAGMTNPIPFSCFDYLMDQSRILVRAADRHLLDERIEMLDSITYQQQKVYEFYDTLLFEMNENHFNIHVDLLADFDNDGDMEEFDYMKEFCVSNFDGRFPMLVGMTPGVEITHGPFTINPQSDRSGKLTYTMHSIGFRNIFGSRPLKLRVSIKDRSLNQSNVIETPEFTIH